MCPEGSGWEGRVAEFVEVNSKLIRWAVDRTGHALDMRQEMPKLASWEALEKAKLSFAELEKLATKTKIPLGYFFLAEPPKEDMPIPDFRTVDDGKPHRISLDLSDTVYAMQRRQAWYASYQSERGLAPLKYVGSANQKTPVEHVSRAIKDALGLVAGWAAKIRSYEDAVSQLRERIEAVGILISIDGVVANNNSRVLSVDEFRGFVLADSYAPLIFINGRDWKSAQIFTMFHELAHVWIEQSGLSDLKDASVASGVEKYCNAVAAEALVPSEEIKSIWYSYRDDLLFERLARNFKVNQKVVARRLFDLKLIDADRLAAFYLAYQGGDPAKKRDPGGDFYNNQIFKIGKRFMKVVARAANDGMLNYAEAYRLTGLTNKTFDKYLERIGGLS